MLALPPDQLYPSEHHAAIVVPFDSADGQPLTKSPTRHAQDTQ
jgi:hypothetical protein